VAEAMSVAKEDQYISDKCSLYDFPCFEIKHSEFE
jgi:hypothetical protein